MPTAAKQIRITSRTCGDATPDAMPPGVMAQLSNLVPDPKNKDIWICRPAAIAFSSTVAEFAPGFISCLLVVGRYAYGMVSSALNPGFDEPFAYDLVAQTFVAITGVTSANVPNSPGTSGAWQPPSMDLIGVYVIVTHPGFNGAGNGFFGWINISAPTAPTWASGNLTAGGTNTVFTVPPTFVKQFNGRAQYIVAPPGSEPATYATDVLNPLLMTHSLILTYGDTKPLYALGVLGLHSILGGITQAMFIFKDDNIFQLTGDWDALGAIGTITLNSLDVAVGTISPLSLASTPRGLAFLSQDGFRIIDWDGRVSDPIGIGGEGIVIPFTNALVPSRVVAACNGQTIRANTQNNAAGGQPFQEWVFDLERKVWHGPHTFPASLIASYGTSYVVSPVGLTGLWQSDILPSTTSLYVENGVQLSWTRQSALVANQDSLYEQAIVQSTVYCAGSGGQGFTMSAQSASGASLDTVSVVPPSAQGSIWGIGIWGIATWGSANSQMSNMIVPWSIPLVFDRVQFTLMGSSNSGVSVGEMRLVLEDLEYMAIPI